MEIDSKGNIVNDLFDGAEDDEVEEEDSPEIIKVNEDDDEIRPFPLPTERPSITISYERTESMKTEKLELSVAGDSLPEVWEHVLLVKDEFHFDKMRGKK